MHALGRTGQVTHSSSFLPGFADAAIAPIDFPIAPTVAIPLALQNAGLLPDDIALYEINEAFSVVVRAAEKVLGLDPAKVNVSVLSGRIGRR